MNSNEFRNKIKRNYLFIQFIENNKSIEYGLLLGSIGYSLLLLYYSKEFKDDRESLNKGIDIIEDTFSDIQNIKYSIFSFYNGLTGIRYIFVYVEKLYAQFYI